MRELSLFTGAGGGILGTMLLGFRPIGYVEWDDYCQRVIAARIRDGILPDAPIFGDIKTFISDGYAASYTGMVDVITGGFPCQPFSVAGKQKGADDERNQWPATATVIEIVKSRFVLLENVPGIRRYMPVVVRDLRRLGYEVSRPLILGADDVGAPHRRKRVWILAHDAKQLDGKRYSGAVQGQIQQSGICAFAADVSDTNETGRREQWRTEPIQKEYPPLKCGGENMADAETTNRGGHDGADNARGRNQEAGRCGFDGLRLSNWPVEPDVGRVANGVARRVDRLKALGNGQVPRVAATAWRILMKEIGRKS